MISAVLFKKMLKSKYKLILIFSCILAMYFTIIAGMFDPDDMDILNQLASLKLSPELLEAMGFTLTDTSLTGFLGSYFYGLLMLAFPMVCYIILCNGLVVKLVDKGSMASLLSTPASRKKIAATQGIFALTAITVMIGFVTILGIIVCEAQFKGLLDIRIFIMLNLGVLLTHFAISGICFFSSCLFNESRKALVIGAGVPIMFLLVQMLYNANKDNKIFKYMTIFSLYNTGDILKGENVLIPMLALVAVTLVFYAGGVFVFDKKDLPI